MLAVVGPTGSGKSQVALALAQELDGEIINCDSVQVYRGFVIGCAKPSDEEQRRAPHHLLDVVEWNEPFDAQRYRELAVRAAAEVEARGRLPILCGGTGLYLRALRWGLVRAPPANPVLRAELMAEEQACPGTLYARLAKVDPPTAIRTEPHNLVHILRALEIHAKSGRPASEVRAEHGFARQEVEMEVVVLRWPAAELRRRIEERVTAMLHAGLLDEVRSLLGRGVSSEARPMQSVGYREASEVALGRAEEEGLAARIAHSTCAYARRQRTWFRRERDVEGIEVYDLERVTAALLSRMKRG